MSVLINNNLIWISVPKCASMSIEKSLLNSDLNSKLHPEYKYSVEKLRLHGHIKKSQLFNEFGIHPTVCITRNWLDRWLSGIEFIWQNLIKENQTMIIDWEDVDNNFIYNTFNSEFFKILHYTNNNEWHLGLNKLLKTNTDAMELSQVLCVLMSQNYWKENQPCTYEFDIKEIHKFEEFIQKRYGVSFEIPLLNSTPKVKNKIVVNDELKNHLWNVFEKPFEKRNRLI